MKQSIINYYIRRQLRLDARQDGGKWGYNKGVANGKRKAGEKKRSGSEPEKTPKIKGINVDVDSAIKNGQKHAVLDISRYSDTAEFDKQDWENNVQRLRGGAKDLPMQFLLDLYDSVSMSCTQQSSAFDEMFDLKQKLKEIVGGENKNELKSISKLGLEEHDQKKYARYIENAQKALERILSEHPEADKDEITKAFESTVSSGIESTEENHEKNEIRKMARFAIFGFSKKTEEILKDAKTSALASGKYSEQELVTANDEITRGRSRYEPKEPRDALATMMDEEEIDALPDALKKAHFVAMSCPDSDVCLKQSRKLIKLIKKGELGQREERAAELIRGELKEGNRRYNLYLDKCRELTETQAKISDAIFELREKQ